MSASAQIFFLERVPTPIGLMLVLGDDQQRLRAVDWEDHEARMHLLLRRQYRNQDVQLRDAVQASPARRALLDYFDGDVRAIDTVAVATGGTDFQRQECQSWRIYVDMCNAQCHPIT